MVEVTENRIVHKVIHDVSFYDEKGHYYFDYIFVLYPSA